MVFGEYYLGEQYRAMFKKNQKVKVHVLGTQEQQVTGYIRFISPLAQPSHLWASDILSSDPLFYRRTFLMRVDLEGVQLDSRLQIILE